ncbi:MAG: ClpX C4-type zinc finger protein [Candidatus Eiseniibacteriota bacterium]
MLNQRKPSCSFCRRGAAAVSKLVAGPRMLLIGPRVHICDQCIGAAQEIINQLPGPGRRAERDRAKEGL